MSAELAAELQMRKAFASPEQECFLAVVRTADKLLGDLVRLFKRDDLSPPLYNVLRILRGAGPQGLNSSEIGGRMVNRDPDVTRLVDRLEARGLAVRERGRTDRRVVRVTIAEAGLELLAKLDSPVLDLHREQLKHMGRRKLRLLIDLLETARTQPEETTPPVEAGGRRNRVKERQP